MVQTKSSKPCCLQGLEQGVNVMIIRLPFYCYEDSSWCSFMANVQIQAAKRARIASYIGRGELNTNSDAEATAN